MTVPILRQANAFAGVVFFTFTQMQLGLAAETEFAARNTNPALWPYAVCLGIGVFLILAATLSAFSPKKAVGIRRLVGGFQTRPPIVLVVPCAAFFFLAHWFSREEPNIPKGAGELFGQIAGSIFFGWLTAWFLAGTFAHGIGRDRSANENGKGPQAG